MKGIQIELGRELVHQLYADDTGICLAAPRENFEKLQEILARYELASGAQVNMSKSLIMPMGGAAVPDWVYHVGCEVVDGERSFKYLGIRLEIPAHLMLTLGCGRKEAKRLEALCQDFVWRVSPEGKPKKALIAWSRVTRSKQLGGLGLFPFTERVEALQMRHLCAILEDQPADWVKMARRILHIKLRIGPQIQERIHWDVSDALLLLPAWRIPEVPTLDRLLIIWFKIKKRLQLDPDVTAIPRYLPIRSLQEIWRLQARQENASFSWLEAESRRRA
ncbi:hypothetical protein R1sor_026346 [Riccia sorocarpa]|uniref:Reverse transcriptase domain-containing protein n=1 Tax=Riccia sorocarpa TaxID=122646 RepID=A0ABD3GB61_9MARC